MLRNAFCSNRFCVAVDRGVIICSSIVLALKPSRWALELGCKHSKNYRKTCSYAKMNFSMDIFRFLSIPVWWRLFVWKLLEQNSFLPILDNQTFLKFDTNTLTQCSTSFIITLNRFTPGGRNIAGFLNKKFFHVNWESGNL